MTHNKSSGTDTDTYTDTYCMLCVCLGCSSRWWYVLGDKSGAENCRGTSWHREEICREITSCWSGTGIAVCLQCSDAVGWDLTEF